MKQPVIIENRAGAGAAIGMEALAKSPPDGYTIGLSTTGSHAINPHLYAKLAYDPVKDFAPITLGISYVNVLVVNPNLPIKRPARTWSPTPRRTPARSRSGRPATARPTTCSAKC